MKNYLKFMNHSFKKEEIGCVLVIRDKVDGFILQINIIDRYQEHVILTNQTESNIISNLHDKFISDMLGIKALSTLKVLDCEPLSFCTYEFFINTKLITAIENHKIYFGLQSIEFKEQKNYIKVMRYLENE